MRRVLRLSLMIPVVLALAGSAFLGPTTGVAAPKKIVIGLSEPSAGWPYISAFMRAFEAEAKKHADIEAIMLSADAKIEKQAKDIEDLIAKKVDILLVCSLDGKAVCPSLKKAADAKIPILAVSNEPDASCQNLLAAYSGPDDEEQGRIAARIMAEALKKKGNVAVIEGTPGQNTSIVRTRGFETELKKLAPGIKILAKQTAYWDPAKAKTVTEAFVTRYGKQLDGLFSHDDNTAAAAAEVLKEAGLIPKVKVVGTGGSKNGVRAIRAGLVYGTMDQSPSTDAKQGLELAMKIVKGEKLDKKRYIIPMPTITQKNANRFEGEW